MAWVKLTLVKLKMRFDPQEFSAVLNEQPNVDDTLTEMMRQAAADIVGRVNQCRKSKGMAVLANVAPLMVPPGSERHAYTLVQFMAGINLPALTQLQGENRRSAYDRAEDHLEDLANCEADGDDIWATEQYVDGCLVTTAPQFGGYKKMDFIGSGAGGVNEPLIPTIVTTQTQIL